MAPDNRIAVCPGTYDPVTFGHLDVISRAAAMFDEVIVAIANNPYRKGSTLFTADERARFLANATRELDNVRIEAFSILVVEFARARGAKALATFGGAIDGMVTPEVADALKERLTR